MKVFLVDDSTMVLKKLVAMISGIEGIEIAGQAMTARDAIQSIVALKPDVVILDIRLNGGGSGMDVLKEIKKEIPPPIVIMLTNYPYPQYREKCQALGADYFFDKVTEIEKIYDTFQQLLPDKSGEGACSVIPGT
jgi:DNA-binding NarL/FixJ family response regulator